MQIHKNIIQCSGRSDKFELIPLGDIHMGTMNCDEKKLEGFIDYIKDRENAYWVGMGDYIEAINYTDKRFQPENIHPRFRNSLNNLVKSQMDYLIQLFNPIKDKCLGILVGNHEITAMKKYHINICDTLAINMNTVNLGYTGMIVLNFKRSVKSGRSIVIYLTHGFGGGIESGGSINRLKKQSSQFEADIYLMGHCHKKICEDAERLCVTLNGSPRLFARKRLFGVTGTFYKTYELETHSYAEQAGYPPTPTGALKILIEPFVKSKIDGKAVDGPPHLHISA